MLRTARSPRRSSIKLDSRYSYTNWDDNLVQFCTRHQILQVDNDLITETVLKDAGVHDEPVLHYDHLNGQLFRGDAIKWMKSLPDESVDLIFADPPYNIKKADWDDFESHEDYVKWSTNWIAEAARLLKPSGSLYVCGFSEILADLKAPSMQFFHSCRWIVWHYKNKANMGNDWGRSHESILHFRKSKYSTFNIDSVRIPYSDHTLKFLHTLKLPQASMVTEKIISGSPIQVGQSRKT